MPGIWMLLGRQASDLGGLLEVGGERNEISRPTYAGATFYPSAQHCLWCHLPQNPVSLVLSSEAFSGWAFPLVNDAFWSYSVTLARDCHHNVLLTENNLWPERICNRNLGIVCLHTDSGRKYDSYLSQRLWVMFSICIFYTAEKKSI